MTTDAASSRPPVVSLVSLGCAKNEVDSERILGRLISSGFMIAADPADADICLVNTCGFIEDARKESAGVLNELQSLKKAGRLKSVVALGCLVERAVGAPETGRFLDAADAQIGFGEYSNIEAICRSLASDKASVPGDDGTGIPVTIGDKRYTGLAGRSHSFTESYREFLTAPRLRIGSPHLAHLKISEGCSNGCRFCAIPFMRGLQVSRPVEDIVQEARELIEGGAKEISLIAQDTTSYGRDLYGDYRLPSLLEALFALKGSIWFRLMYAFPRFLNDAMLQTMAAEPRMCPYIDMPLQHIADGMLMGMGRGMTKRDTVAALDRIRLVWPDGAIRTTFIVGYPGETDDQFEELLAFVQEGRFTHAGVFMYSHEPKTPAAKLPDSVPLAIKKKRRDALMTAQREVSRKRLQARVGSIMPVMVDGAPDAYATVPRGVQAMGRTRLQASEVDGVVFLAGRAAARLEPGSIVDVRIEKSLDYDLIGRVV